MARTGAHEPADRRDGSALSKSHDVCITGIDQGTDAPDHRRCGPLRSVTVAADVYGANQRVSIAGHSGSRTFELLGKAGDLQPRSPRIHRETLDMTYHRVRFTIGVFCACLLILTFTAWAQSPLLSISRQGYLFAGGKYS